MDSIIGHNAGLRSVLERARLVAKSDVPVLILGETGSGKEVFARHIHEQSRRAKLPFLKVNCGAVPSELIDSYLFGHEKGAFTGAMEKRKGWFESAHGGTLLLDEIGELPLAAQVRFLRVLQDGSFESVGGTGKTIRVDVRIIAATHRNLRQMVNEGKFREDLWYRISVFPIRIPPLRERMCDLTELAFYFARRATKKFGLAEIDIRHEDIEVLNTYNWPGNVREFGAVIDRAVLLGEGRQLALVESLRELKLENGDDFDPVIFVKPDNNVEQTVTNFAEIADKYNNTNNENKNNTDNKTDLVDNIDSPVIATVEDTNEVVTKQNAPQKNKPNHSIDSIDEIDEIDAIDALPQDQLSLNESSTLDEQTQQEDPTQEQIDAEYEAEIAKFLSLNDAVKKHIEAALELTNGTIEGDYGAAAALKMNPHTLRAKMRRLGIEWSRFRKG
ncbi:MAG: sigma-54 dependent transcriptional regulator [Planctomycetaceae bacterium]|jgi:transcriptional regulator with GAF, ATPase, and Fis domain|nr:sigma-54 dependent transcriptional regulator [Planctomycetaceae bacterium]